MFNSELGKALRVFTKAQANLEKLVGRMRSTRDDMLGGLTALEENLRRGEKVLSNFKKLMGE